MIKALHLLDTLERGGAETIALDVCRNAARHDIELTVVATRGGPLEDDFRAAAGDFIRLHRKLPVDPRVVFNLRKIIKKKEIQVVHGYQPVEGLHLYLATLGLKNPPVRRVLSFQGGMRPSGKNIRAARYLIPRMDANIAVSQGILDHHRDVDKFDTTKNFHVIYNGTDPARIKPGGHSLKNELGLSENTRLIGMVGNFYRDPRKDQLTICRALPKVFAEFDNVHCIFAGTPEPGAEYKLQECIELCRAEGIAERVHFLGARADIPDVLAALEIFVFSSLHEGLPLAVTEAMLAGVPLIVSDIGPLMEVSDGGNLAEVFPVGDAEALAEKILKLLKNDRLRKGMGLSAREFAAENFSIDAHLRQLKKLYGSLL